MNSRIYKIVKKKKKKDEKKWCSATKYTMHYQHSALVYCSYFGVG